MAQQGVANIRITIFPLFLLPLLPSIFSLPVSPFVPVSCRTAVLAVSFGPVSCRTAVLAVSLRPCLLQDSCARCLPSALSPCLLISASYPHTGKCCCGDRCREQAFTTSSCVLCGLNTKYQCGRMLPYRRDGSQCSNGEVRVCEGVRGCAVCLRLHSLSPWRLLTFGCARFNSLPARQVPWFSPDTPQPLPLTCLVLEAPGLPAVCGTRA
jgi:hypothetical protein